MRLDKFLSDSTELSRKDIKQHIKKKSVMVNGVIAQNPQMQVTADDEITLLGENVSYKRFVYLILNKPQGYVSATEDNHYPTVCDLVPEGYRHFGVFSAGRLDIDTEGLLILTNDGAFAHSITSPKKEVYKRYFARLDKPVEEEDINIFASGIVFKDFTAKPARLEICENPYEAYVEIAEGKYHQVKRMFERTGKTVVYLRRDAIGGLCLPQDLKLGDMIETDREELSELIFKEE